MIYLSLGAGVQSSTVALMAATGAIPPIDGAIFADTQAEPAGVYRWLDWLEVEIARSASPFVVHRVTAGSLELASVEVRRSKKSGKVYSRNLIPAYVQKPDGTKGIFGRRCTRDFKVHPIQRKMRQLLGLKRVMTREVLADQLIGISIDEAHRMKDSPVAWIRNVYPLIDLKMSREDCLTWMKEKGYPQPPRSACVFCPFHGDREWMRLRDEEPVEFARACEFEAAMQAAAAKDQVMTGRPFLHASLTPLSEVRFRDLPNHGQLELFGNECEGMCGV